MGTDEHGRAARSSRTRTLHDWHVREATTEDAALLFRWRNDSADAHSYRTGSPGSWGDHLPWLENSIARQDRLILIISDELGDVGVVRWDERTSRQWEVSIIVDPGRRGHSLAHHMLTAGEVYLSRSHETTDYLAVVHSTNTPSLRLFARSGYLPDVPVDDSGFLQLRKTAPAATSTQGQR